MILTKTHLAMVFDYAEGGDLYHYLAYAWLSTMALSLLVELSQPGTWSGLPAGRKGACQRLRHGLCFSSWSLPQNTATSWG